MRTDFLSFVNVFNNRRILNLHIKFKIEKMKKITPLLLLLLILNANSQTTYNDSDFAQINDSFIISQANTGLQALDFVVTGTNFNWDYSTLSATTQQTITWDNPNNTGYKATWCAANGFVFTCNTEFNNAFNLANASFEGIEIQGNGLTNIVNHYNLNTSTLENKMLGGTINVGGVGVPLAVDYTSSDVVYQFPINYNDNYSNTGSYAIDLNGLGIPVSYSETIQRTNNVEGWGSLITPFGTFNDVLKMKTTVVRDVVVTTATETIPTTTTTIFYKWFDPNYGVPVLEVSGQDVAGQFVATSANYIDNQQCLSPVALFGFLPVVPEYDYTTNSATVSFINTSANYDQVEWDFGDGTILTDENPSHTFSCPGIQQVTLTVTNTFCNPAEIDMITLPINITDPDDAYTNSVTNNGSSLSADRITAGTTYQWLDCNNGNMPISGETNQIFTPTADGSYAVQLSTNGCVSVSDCIPFQSLSVSEVNLSESKITIYPNPTKGVINISNPNNIKIEDITLFNTMGQQVSKSLDLSPLDYGVYFLILKTEDGVVSEEIIKE